MLIQKKAAPNSTITKLISVSIAVLISFSILFILIYQILIPELVQDQIESRAKAITTFFAGAVLEHIVARDYLTINKLTENITTLPDVGYACVINDSGNVIAGLFSNLDTFDTKLINEVKENGFPSNIASQIHLTERNHSATSSHQIGGRDIINYAFRLENANAEIHVGILTEDAIRTSQHSIIPYAFLLLITTLLGIITFVWILRTT